MVCRQQCTTNTTRTRSSWTGSTSTLFLLDTKTTGNNISNNTSWQKGTFRYLSTNATATEATAAAAAAAAELSDSSYDSEYLPMGDLFTANKQKIGGSNWIGKTASIKRAFMAGSNAQGLLTCGGEQLARHASFDPEYSRAQGWIHNHAVGPAVISPVLISGLVGALVEAAMSHSVPVSCSMRQVRPLIVSNMTYQYKQDNHNREVWHFPIFCQAEKKREGN
jgi:hypothetical protein